MVRRTGDHGLFTFLVKAITKQLATADKLFPMDRRAGCLAPCPLCGGIEDHMHPLRCRFSRVARHTSIRATARGLADLCNWVAASGAVSSAQCARLMNIGSADFFGVRSTCCLTFESHDKFAGALGILPHCFSATLAPEQELTGAEQTVKQMRKRLPGRIRDFQLMTLRETMAVYSSWTCHAGRPGAACSGRGVRCT
jgi:hypothetical protein